MPYAVIFPGQGAAAPGAGRAWVDHQAWDVVGQAETVLDRPVARLLLEADAAELAATGAGQLAVLLTSLVAWEALATPITYWIVGYLKRTEGVDVYDFGRPLDARA